MTHDSKKCIEIVLNITPKGKRRTKAAVINGHAHVYKDSEQARYEHELQIMLLPFLPRESILGPVLLGVKAFMPMPKKKSLAWQTDAKKGIIRPTSKPDLDNLIKNITDCLMRVGFFGDDSVIVGYLPGTGKYYSTTPRWEIEICNIL